MLFSLHGTSTQNGQRVAYWVVGAEVGGVRGPATLIVRTNALTLYSGFDKYRLLPNQVVSFIEEENGIRILHISSKISSKVLLSSPKSGSEMTSVIREIGFSPSAKVEQIPIKKGSAFRRTVLSVGILIWNLLILPAVLKQFKIPIPDIFPEILKAEFAPMMALLLLFLMSLLTRYIPILQRIILKSGRDFGEVSGAFSLISMISFTLLISFLRSPEANGPTFSPLFFLIVAVVFLGHRLHAFLSEGI